MKRPRLTDSHCHLPMSAGGSKLLDRARAAGVRGFIVPATRLEDLDEAVGVAAGTDDVWSAAGFHPHEAKDFDDAAAAAVAGAATRERVVAIGEIGLDYHYDHSPRDVQRAVFARQLAIAKEADLPVIVHNRESTRDLLEILGSEEARGVRGVIHSFTESWEVARTLIDLGMMVSFSGILTFRKAETLRDSARRCPRDSVMIETDTPYLAPVPHRGKPNEPAFVLHVAEALAACWGTSVDEASEATARNFESLFRVTLP